MTQTRTMSIFKIVYQNILFTCNSFVTITFHVFKCIYLRSRIWKKVTQYVTIMTKIVSS